MSKKTNACVRLGYLTLQKEKIEAEIKELRESLEKAINPGESIDFVVEGYADVEDQSFTLKNSIEDKAVLKTNEMLSKVLGKANFIEIAKISKTEVEKVFGKAVAVDCVDHYDTQNRLVLKKNKS